MWQTRGLPIELHELTWAQTYKYNQATLWSRVGGSRYLGYWLKLYGYQLSSVRINRVGYQFPQVSSVNVQGHANIVSSLLTDIRVSSVKGHANIVSSLLRDVRVCVGQPPPASEQPVNCETRSAVFPEMNVGH